MAAVYEAKLRVMNGEEREEYRRFILSGQLGKFIYLFLYLCVILFEFLC